MTAWESSSLGDDFGAASVFDVYDELLVPLLFAVYADDVAARLADVPADALLELAAGTGAVTRALASTLPDDVAITATDIVPGMIDRARRIGTARPVDWRPADALSLPFAPESFDVVVCQFGAMFFDPKADAFAEAHRVLRPGGTFVFSVWDAIADNEFADVVNATVGARWPEDPPAFLERLPHGYHDPDTIRADLRAGGFGGSPSVDRLEHVSRAATPLQVATAYCTGTPLRDQIVGRDPEALPGAIAEVADALERRFGSKDPEGRISARFVTLIK
jgi:SAM-dependent methyltransferase